jgi:phage shock protein PspC (stress-responsive transcriptional regulator)
MTETPPQQETQPGPTGFDRDALRDFDRLRRSTTDRKIAGVAGGLGRHLNIDPTILRVLFVVLVFFGGAGLLLYGAAWLLVPEDGSDEAAISTSPSTRTTALVVAGVIGVLLVLGDSWGGFGFPWPLAIVALVVVLFLINKDRPKTPAAPGTTTPPAAPTSTGVGWPQADQPDAASYDAPGAPGTTGTTALGWVGDTTSERPAEESTPGQVPPAPPYGTGSWAPTPPPYQPKPSKKDRGPKLFGITLALVAVGLGALGLYDALGGSPVDSAYPAVALTIVGAMLLVGAFVGRPGGLIFLGIVAALALAVSSAGEEYGWDQRTDRVERPQSAAALPSEYRMSVGSMVVDLTEIDNLQALDGRDLDIQAGFGEILVIVPDGVDVNVDSNISLGGDIAVGDNQRNGNSPQLTDQIDGGVDVPDMTIDIELAAGRIDVHQEAAA